MKRRAAFYLIAMIMLLTNGCGLECKPRGKIVCYQNEDFFACSTIVYGEDLASSFGDVDQYISFAMDGLGKAESVKSSIACIENLYVVGPIPATQWEFQYWKAYRSKNSLSVVDVSFTYQLILYRREK